MPSADLVDNYIVINNISYRDRDSVHELPGYSYKNKITRCKVSWPALKVLTSLFPNRLEIGEALREWAWKEYSERVEPATEAHDWAMQPENECSEEFSERLRRCNLA